MNATEFLKLKGILDPTRSIFIIRLFPSKDDINLAELMEEYHAIASGQNIDLDKKLENIIDLDSRPSKITVVGLSGQILDESEYAYNNERNSITIHRWLL